MRNSQMRSGLQIACSFTKFITFHQIYIFFMGFPWESVQKRWKNVHRFSVGQSSFLQITPVRVKSQSMINLHMHDYNHSPQKYSNINTGLSTRSSTLPLTNELMDHGGGEDHVFITFKWDLSESLFKQTPVFTHMED